MAAAIEQWTGLIQHFITMWKKGYTQKAGPLPRFYLRWRQGSNGAL